MLSTDADDLPQRTCMLYSVVVITPDSESGNPGSNPGTAMELIVLAQTTD